MLFGLFFSFLGLLVYNDRHSRVHTTYYYMPRVKVSFFMCSLVESRSCESDEIRLSPSHQRERETTRYSPVNNEKNHVRHDVSTRPFDRIQIVVFEIKFNVINFSNKIFHVFSYVVRYIFSFVWLLVYNKILIDWDLGKAVYFVYPRLTMFLGVQHRQSRERKTYCFPRSQ